MSVPRVSIVIPVFNGEMYLEETVESVFGQTFEDWELLLLDDGSSDTSGELARRYAAARPGKVRYLEQPGRENHGQFAARVSAARQARAEVLALLDQDDVWDREYLEEHLRVWDRLRPQNVALSYGPSRYWFPDVPDGSKDFVQPMPSPVPKVYAPGEVLESFLASNFGNTPCPSCTLIRREIFRSSVERFAQAAKGSHLEDQYLWWYVAARFPVAVHGGAWVRYRQHRASALATATASADRVRQAELTFFEAISDDLAAECPEHPLLKQAALGERIRSLKTGASPASATNPLRSLLGGVRRMLPRPVKRAARGVLNLNARRGRARMAFGVRPLSYEWGADRGRPIHRYYLEQFLEEHAGDVRGRCLEFMDPNYTRRFGGAAVTKADVLHIDDSNPSATIVADLTQPNDVPSDLFDCVICTHVLHVVYRLEKAVAELHRILRPGGVLLVAVPQVSMCDSNWHELWRFTPEGLSLLLAEAFGAENVSVRAYGNSLVAAGDMRGLAAHEFTEAELNYCDPGFAVEVCARAVKSGGFRHG